MKRFYITFGQNHIHRVNCKTFDADTVATFEAIDENIAREYAFDNFQSRWSMIYDKEPDLILYPNGLIEI